MTKNTQTAFAKNSPLRVSTVEIDDAVQQLQTAYSDGRLDDNELEERMDKAIKAKTAGDLSELFVDLDRVEQAQAKSAASSSVKKSLRRLQSSSSAIFSGVEQTGNFILPKSYTVSAIFGGCLIDLRSAHLESKESTIHVSAIFGGAKIIVGKDVRVEIQSTQIFGGVSKKVHGDDVPDDAPVIYIIAEAIFGGIEITR